jgi:hypothetical protein
MANDNNNEDVFLNDLPLWADDEAQRVLKATCDKYKVPVDVIAQLVGIQRERQHQERARGISKAFEEVLGLIE